MTQTTNIGLKKIDGSENWRQIFDYHNDSADKTDSAVAAVQDGLAIVANGNTHAAVAEGQFVYVRNHSTLAEGLYKASSAIGTNGELTTSNLTADGSGGLNDLQEQVTSLNSNINTEWFQRLRLGYLMESRIEARDQPSTINNFFNGLTYVSSTSQGAPADYCLVMAFSVASYAVQFAVQAYSTNIWLRSGSTDGNNWAAWKQITVS